MTAWRLVTVPKRVDSEANAPTVLDVIENALGSSLDGTHIYNLSDSEFDELHDRLSEFWEAQAAEKLSSEAYLLGNWLHAYWSEPLMRPDLSDSLLYYSSLLVLDPLADFFGNRTYLPIARGIRYRRSDGQFNTICSGPRMWSNQGCFEALRETGADPRGHVARIVDNLRNLAPLIRSGVLVLRSQWPTLRNRTHHLASSVLRDTRLPQMQAIARAPRNADQAIAIWDNVRGLQMRMDGPVHPADEPWQTEAEFFNLAKTLAVADAANSQYVPSTEVDLEFLRAKLNTNLAPRYPGELLREVSRVLVPSIDVPIERAIEMRQSSENFEDWRSSLNDLRRNATATSPDELSELVADALRPRARAVQRELRRSSLSISTREASAELVVSSAAGLGTAFTTQDGFITAGVGAGAGVLTWMIKAYMREGPSGANAVLAALVRKS